MNKAVKSNSSKSKKKVKRSVLDGIAHIQASFNNTVVSISDTQGNVIAWSTAGHSNFKGSRKSTPYAGGIAASNALNKALEYGLKNLTIKVKGPGPGREQAIRVLGQSSVKVQEIIDVTPIPHNGCRAEKERRG